mgnify:CR=1 FL=1
MSITRFSANIYNEILNIIRRYGGTVRDEEIYEALKRIFDLSYSEFQRKLMVLEIKGYITVSTRKDGGKIVSLLRRAR